jgi:hypothetical protein
MLIEINLGLKSGNLLPSRLLVERLIVKLAGARLVDRLSQNQFHWWSESPMPDVPSGVITAEFDQAFRFSVINSTRRL